MLVFIGYIPIYCKKRAKLIGLAVSGLNKFPVKVKDAEVNTAPELLAVAICLVDGWKGYRGEAVSNPVVYDDGAGNCFHISPHG